MGAGLESTHRCKQVFMTQLGFHAGVVMSSVEFAGKRMEQGVN